MLTEEELKEFKEISNFEGYFISKDARIYSKKLGRFLKCDGTNKGGYRVAVLYKKENEKNKKYYKYLHRLVAETYIANPNGYNIIDHCDLNKLNNNMSNLRWVNSSMSNNNRSISKKDIHTFCKDTGNFIKYYNTIKELQEELGCGLRHLYTVLDNPKKSAKGLLIVQFCNLTPEQKNSIKY